MKFSRRGSKIGELIISNGSDEVIKKEGKVRNAKTMNEKKETARGSITELKMVRKSVSGQKKLVFNKKQ